MSYAIDLKKPKPELIDTCWDVNSYENMDSTFVYEN